MKKIQVISLISLGAILIGGLTLTKFKQNDKHAIRTIVADQTPTALNIVSFSGVSPQEYQSLEGVLGLLKVSSSTPNMVNDVLVGRGLSTTDNSLLFNIDSALVFKMSFTVSRIEFVGSNIGLLTVKDAQTDQLQTIKNNEVVFSNATNLIEFSSLDQFISLTKIVFYGCATIIFEDDYLKEPQHYLNVNMGLPDLEIPNIGLEPSRYEYAFDTEIKEQYIMLWYEGDFNVLYTLMQEAVSKTSWLVTGGNYDDRYYHVAGVDNLEMNIYDAKYSMYEIGIIILIYQDIPIEVGWPYQSVLGLTGISNIPPLEGATSYEIRDYSSWFGSLFAGIRCLGLTSSVIPAYEEALVAAGFVYEAEQYGYVDPSRNVVVGYEVYSNYVDITLAALLDVYQPGDDDPRVVEIQALLDSLFGVEHQNYFTLPVLDEAAISFAIQNDTVVVEIDGVVESEMIEIILNFAAKGYMEEYNGNEYYDPSEYVEMYLSWGGVLLAALDDQGVAELKVDIVFNLDSVILTVYYI